MVKQSSNNKPIGGQSSGSSKPSTAGPCSGHKVVRAGDSSKGRSSSPGPRSPKK